MMLPGPSGRSSFKKIAKENALEKISELILSSQVSFQNKVIDPSLIVLESIKNIISLINPLET
jgi:hypothetical protein